MDLGLISAVTAAAAMSTVTSFLSKGYCGPAAGRSLLGDGLYRRIHRQQGDRGLIQDGGLSEGKKNLGRPHRATATRAVRLSLLVWTCRRGSKCLKAGTNHIHWRLISRAAIEVMGPLWAHGQKHQHATSVEIFTWILGPRQGSQLNSQI